MRERFVLVGNELVPWALVSARRRERARSSLPCPMIISDHLDDVQNPVDGKRYDSKSAYYKTVREAGCEIVGNEAEKMVARPPPRSNVGYDEIGEALARVKQGYKPEIRKSTDD